MPRTPDEDRPGYHATDDTPAVPLTPKQLTEAVETLTTENSGLKRLVASAMGIAVAAVIIAVLACFFPRPTPVPPPVIDQATIQTMRADIAQAKADASLAKTHSDAAAMAKLTERVEGLQGNIEQCQVDLGHLEADFSRFLYGGRKPPQK